jgi:hypothetical protein
MKNWNVFMAGQWCGTVYARTEGEALVAAGYLWASKELTVSPRD